MSDDNGNNNGLFADDDVTPPKHKSKKTKGPITDGSTLRAEKVFKDAFAAKCIKHGWVLPNGYPIPIDWAIGRDRRLLKDLIALYGEATVIDVLIPEFFAIRPEAMRLDWKVPSMRIMAQRLLMQRGKQTLHQRTSDNIVEARKALEKRR